MSEQIIIASVTKMAKGLCIGGYILPHGWWPSDFTPLGPVRSVRLIPAGELWHPYTNEWKLAPRPLPVQTQTWFQRVTRRISPSCFQNSNYNYWCRSKPPPPARRFPC